MPATFATTIWAVNQLRTSSLKSDEPEEPPLQQGENNLSKKEKRQKKAKSRREAEVKMIKRRTAAAETLTSIQ